MALRSAVSRDDITYAVCEYLWQTRSRPIVRLALACREMHTTVNQFLSRVNSIGIAQSDGLEEMLSHIINVSAPNTPGVRKVHLYGPTPNVLRALESFTGITELVSNKRFDVGMMSWCTSLRQLSMTSMKWEEVEFFPLLVELNSRNFLPPLGVSELDLSHMKELRIIGDDWASMKNVVEIAFPPTVEVIGFRAFFQTSLVNLDLSNLLNPKAIGTRSFAHCSDLACVLLPPSVESLGAFCFSNSGLTGLDLSTALNLTVIGPGAFLQCSKLASVRLPRAIESLGADCFKGTRLTSIDLSIDFSDGKTSN